MCKESREAGLHRRFKPDDSKWRARDGKTKRDHESGAWANHIQNQLGRKSAGI